MVYSQPVMYLLLQLNEELSKVDEKLKKTESLLKSKNLKIMKINDDKKQALAAQFAAKSTFRRVHAARKDDDIPLTEATLAPSEAELKLVKMEVYYNLKFDIG
ncbi:microtubule-associated protein 70-1-like isoform X2 [Rutidosis leptorrhynchoides]|uniref:microtubule-associated protein 70-1-like isoform X2 n=1 Tax=Rutidosis leptorrhynchoides TaxID=125765 RepID=UPI003A99FE50